jgi:alpha-ribazole phosphatase
VLVRHGEPDECVRSRCYGRLDVSLSPWGREQMLRARHLLGEGQVSAIYSSPSRRALESAGLLAQCRTPVKVERGFSEIDFGELEGLSYDEIAERFPETYGAWMNRPTEVTFPGGETFSDMTARVRKAFDEVRRAHNDEVVVIVSHAGVNRIVLATVLGLDLRRIFRLDQAYACVNVIDYFGKEPVVRLINAAP